MFKLIVSLCLLFAYSEAAVHTSCGGVVEVTRAEPATISYKFNEEYGNDEQCVWTVRATDSHALKYTKTASEFEERYDFLQASAFRTDNLIGPVITRTLGNVNEQEEIEIDAPIVFLVFSTDDSNTGKGFNLEIEAVDDHAYTYLHVDYFSDSIPGNVSLRPYFSNMIATYVITTTELPELDMSIEYSTVFAEDIISVFHVERNGGRILFFPYGLLSGSSLRRYSVTRYTTFVVFFSSDWERTEAGFDIAWYTK